MRQKGFAKGDWSSGRRWNMSIGDRVYLMKCGEHPRGIMGSAIVTSEPYEDTFPDNQPGHLLTWDSLLDPESERFLCIEEMESDALKEYFKRTQNVPNNGILIPADEAVQLRKEWVRFQARHYDERAEQAELIRRRLSEWKQ